MPFNGSGIYTPSAADFPAVAGTLILSTKFNNNINDIATALSDCVTRDGQSPPTANLPMGGFKFVNVADGTSRASPVANFASLGQVQDGGVWWAGTAGGTADALTLTMTPAVPAYVAGQRFVFKSGAGANTGAATVAVSGLAAKALQSGGAALTAGQIEANEWYSILYDGAAFQLGSIQLVSISGPNSFTGLISVIDGNFSILGSADATKKLRFEVDGFTTGTTRTITPPDMATLLVSTVVKRKTADESVTSSTALQDDDHLTFAIGANEEWVTDYFLDVGTNLSVSKFKWAITIPAGATLNATAQGVGTAATDTSQIRTTTGGSGVVLGFTGSGDAFILISVWVLNGATPGNVTLQWAQSVSNGVATTVRKGSHLMAHRVA